jgi:hypothetical protein
MTPHLFFRPRTLLPSIMTVRSEPTTAKGIIAYPHQFSRTFFSQETQFVAYPDLGVDLDLLVIRLLSVEGVQTNVVVNEFGANLRGMSRSVHILHIGIHNPSASDT